MNEFSGKSSSQIVSELEKRRERLRRDIDGLSGQFKPDQILETAKSALSSSGSGEFTRNLGRSLRDNPLPAALIGAGVAWMIVGQGGKRRPTGAEDFVHRSEISGQADYDVDALQGADSDRANSGGASVKKSLAAAEDSARDHLSAIGERLSDAQARSQQAATDASEKIQRSYTANPLIFGLSVAAVAAIFGSLLPRTEREDEVLGDYAVQARKQLRKATETAVSKASDVVEKTAETARDEAEKRGYDADTAEASVSEAIDDAHDIAKKSAETLKEESKAAADKDSEAKEPETERGSSA